MRFVDISVSRFGVLEDCRLSDLSPGLTVVYGNNGSGKSTLVSFVRGLLFGYSTDHQAFQLGDTRYGGSVSLDSRGRSWRFTRERHGISSDLSKVDLETGVTEAANGNELPVWVNEVVHREVFSVGDQEASRFDLLSRLCLDGSTSGDAEEEIRKADLAIEQSIREREGNGVEGGLRHRIASLQSQREDKERQLAEQRRTSPEVPAQITRVEAEIDQQQVLIAAEERHLAGLSDEIRALEDRLERLRRRNSVALDRAAIDRETSVLAERLERWEQIRHSIQRELTQLRPAVSGSGSSSDSLKSVRALVSRLEERVATIAAASSPQQHFQTDHLRSEVFSLCDYVTQHEAAVAAHDAAVEVLLGERALHDAQGMESVLQGRIDALQAEMRRCDDVLPESASVALDCSSHQHADFRRTERSSDTVHGSIAETEARLAQLRDDRGRRQLNLATAQDRLQALRRQLAELQQQLKAAIRLEDIDRLKADMASVTAELTGLHARWNVLENTENRLRAVIERLREYSNNDVLELASEYVVRLTDGDCHRLIADSSNSRILAETHQVNHPIELSQLSRGTRDQVGLALRLALIQVRSTDSGRCPLILDDVFITSDDARGQAAADLLTEIAASGQQILFLTCQNDVRDLFVARSAAVRTLNDQPVAVPMPEAPPVTLMATPVSPPPESVARENTNWLYYLEVDNSVEDLSGLTVAEVEALRASGIETIDTLLSLSVDELEDRFRGDGYAISRDRIRAWRGQAEMATRIPMLRRRDAELLYAAGISSTIELSRMRPETVYEMVVAFQETRPGSRFRRSGQSVDRQQAISWARWSQHARTLHDARTSRSHHFVQFADEFPRTASGSAQRTRSESSGRHRRTGTSEGRTAVRRQKRPQLSDSDRRRRANRRSQRRERVQQHASSYRTAQSPQSGEAEVSTLKFYLNRSNDVDAAPSIGPRTAQKLAAADVYTVDDLLDADAGVLAATLDNRRISEDTIVQWQSQARLVCQVPQLRGHDAQLLVACGVTDPEELAGKRAVDLLAVVGPFANTSEGERIIRGGQKPDLEEVTDWIAWAQQSRSLSAAA